MFPRGSHHFRDSIHSVLDQFLLAAEKAYGGGNISIDGLRTLADMMKKSERLKELEIGAFKELLKILQQEIIEQKRSNVFGRLIVHPLTELLDSGVVGREYLPNFFSFLHLVLGEQEDVFSNRCQELVHELRLELEDDFNWDAFYADPRAKGIFFHVLLRIAQSFHRFDPRKDWFITLMQYSPSSISLSSSSFLAKDRDAGETRAFTQAQFLLLFKTLFAPVRHLGPEDEALFQKVTGMPSAKAFGPFLLNLARM